MATLTEAAAWLWVWIKGNPWTTFLVFYAVLNVLYAQLPKPKNPKLLKVWEISHWMLQLVVTNAKDAGTLTWPGLVRFVLRVLCGATSGDFGRVEEPTNPGTPIAKKDSLPPTAAEIPGTEEGKT